MVNFKNIDNNILLEWNDFKPYPLASKEYEWVASFVEEFYSFIRKNGCNLNFFDCCIKKCCLELMDRVTDKSSILYAHINSCIQKNDFSVFLNDIFKLQECIVFFKS